ncbi:response regulator transcription factor [bacterium]|nr:response regulator transcription factor [bacterium]
MQPKIKILIVEDEESIHKLIKAAVSADEYQIISAFDGKEGIQAAASHQPDLVILDLGLPNKVGFEVISSIRGWSDSLPILILSARTDEESKVKALDDGANDFVSKPFSVAELLARVRALLRFSRQKGLESNELTVGPFHLDVAAHILKKNGTELHLTPTEFKLFALLAKNANRVILHKQLLKDVWGPGFGTDVQYLRVFMKQLRQKVEDSPSQPSYIITEPGVGYRFKLT